MTSLKFNLHKIRASNHLMWLYQKSRRWNMSPISNRKLPQFFTLCEGLCRQQIIYKRPVIWIQCCGKSFKSFSVSFYPETLISINIFASVVSAENIKFPLCTCSIFFFNLFFFQNLRSPWRKSSYLPVSEFCPRWSQPWGQHRLFSKFSSMSKQYLAKRWKIFTSYSYSWNITRYQKCDFYVLYEKSERGERRY